MARRPKTAKLAANEDLREYVHKRLCGEVRRPDGAVAGPATAPWKGRDKPRRQDRRWATAWSPQQIAHRVKVDFADDESMRISHEAIYQSLYVQGRGALKARAGCLPVDRPGAARLARSLSGPRQGFVTDEVTISERPAEAEDRAVPGHWAEAVRDTIRDAISECPSSYVGR